MDYTAQKKVLILFFSTLLVFSTCAAEAYVRGGYRGGDPQVNRGVNVRNTAVNVNRVNNVNVHNNGRGYIWNGRHYNYFYNGRYYNYYNNGAYYNYYYKGGYYNYYYNGRYYRYFMNGRYYN